MNTVKSLNSTKLNQNFSTQDSARLHSRWQAIRLQEIRRQLSIMSDQSLFITTEHSIDCAKIIYIPSQVLTLPIEMLAAIAAFSWGEKMGLRSKQNPEDLTEIFNFVGNFLVKYHYPVERIIHFALTESEPALLETFPVFKQHLLSFILAYQKGKNSAACIQRKVRIKTNKPICLSASIG